MTKAPCSITRSSLQYSASLTLSRPVLSNGYTLKCSGPYWSNHPFLVFFDILALWRSGLSARVPECQYIKKGGLDHAADCAERFSSLIFAKIRKSIGLKGLKRNIFAFFSVRHLNAGEAGIVLKNFYPSVYVYVSVCVCLSVCPRKNSKTTGQNLMQFVWLRWPPEATRFRWRLTLTFDLEDYFRILLVFSVVAFMPTETRQWWLRYCGWHSRGESHAAAACQYTNRNGSRKD